MVIIVYSLNTEKSILGNLGKADYSYYFVQKRYLPVLTRYAKVVEVENPEQEVDPIYESCRYRGERCVFLSFTPPFKTAVNLKCPTISVFAWEYLTIPTDIWGRDPRNDWRFVFRRNGYAITHSSFAVEAVKKAMGRDFPVWSIPAPVWDDYVKLYGNRKTRSQSENVDLAIDGSFLDFKGCNIAFLPEEKREAYIRQRLFCRDNKREGIKIQLNGVVYTSVFNSGDNRKNWTDMVKGYIWAFREKEDVTLILKVVFYNVKEACVEITSELFKLTPFKCRVVVIFGYLPDKAYADLIRATTYVVNTAHGEGQNLPLMEFMSAGTPAIAPIHTAMRDYVSEDNTFVVESSPEKAYWAHDPRQILRTMRYRINWESLFNAYQESFAVAKNDPVRYAKMSGCAVDSLKKYCSTAVVEKRLRSVFWSQRFRKENMSVVFAKKIRHVALKLKFFLKSLSTCKVQ